MDTTSTTHVSIKGRHDWVDLWTTGVWPRSPKARHSPCTEPAQVASTSLSVAMKCFLVRLQLSTLAVGHARSLDLPSWVARRVDLRSTPTRSIEDTASLSLYARGTSCACGLLDHSAEGDGRSWRLTKQAGAALANLFHRLGTKVSPGSFTVSPIWVDQLYRAIYPLSVQTIDLLPFIDELIAGTLSKEARHCVGYHPNPSVWGGALLAPPVFEGRDQSDGRPRASD